MEPVGRCPSVKEWWYLSSYLLPLSLTCNSIWLMVNTAAGGSRPLQTCHISVCRGRMGKHWRVVLLSPGFPRGARGILNTPRPKTSKDHPLLFEVPLLWNPVDNLMGSQLVILTTYHMKVLCGHNKMGEFCLVVFVFFWAGDVPAMWIKLSEGMLVTVKDITDLF